MPKNKGKGGKNRRRGKNENEGLKRELVFKEDGQEYAQVIKMLGNGRLEAMCFDGVKRLCHIRGKLRKKVWINQSDIILVGLRDYQASLIFPSLWFLIIPTFILFKLTYSRCKSTLSWCYRSLVEKLKMLKCFDFPLNRFRKSKTYYLAVD